MIREFAGLHFGIHDAPYAYVYAREKDQIAALRIFDDTRHFTLSWRGEADLRLILDSVEPIAREVGEFSSSIPEPARRFDATYLVGAELVQLTHVLNPKSREEHNWSGRHEAFLAEYGRRVAFARYDAHSKTPAAFWADIRAPKPEVGFSSMLVPDYLFRLMQRTRTDIATYDLRQIREYVDRHQQRFISFA